jgi:hypothetical protein
MSMFAIGQKRTFSRSGDPWPCGPLDDRILAGTTQHDLGRTKVERSRKGSDYDLA